MFMINSAPLGIHRTLKDYANFLIKRYIIAYFKQGCKEVHIIFDNPGRLGKTPKYFEQSRRDESANISANHYCDDLCSNTTVSRGKWRENFLNCRECKRKLVIYLGEYFLSNIHSFLHPGQTLYVAGAFEGAITDTVWSVSHSNKREPQPAYTSNAEETDMRIWLHATRTSCDNLLIVSPDTDVYHIGLTMLCSKQKEIIVQVSQITSRQLKFIDLGELLNALQTDPDLTQLNQQLLPSILQTIYTVSGCDYISFFSEIGKATFLRRFFENATFITGGSSIAPGTLAHTTITDETSIELGFLSFLRLIGTIYFKKYASGFDTQSPANYFKRFIDPTKSIKEHHVQWMNSIRDNIWCRTKFENQTIPSTDSLYLHWKRSCWVLHMWNQASNNTITLADMENFGWKIIDHELTIVWDTEQNTRNIQMRLDAILKGCKCTTGCTTARCGCKRKGTLRSEGCDCVNCKNMEQSLHIMVDDLLKVSLEEEMTPENIQDNQVEELMEWVFEPTETEAGHPNGD